MHTTQQAVMAGLALPINRLNCTASAARTQSIDMGSRTMHVALSCAVGSFQLEGSFQRKDTAAHYRSGPANGMMLTADAAGDNHLALLAVLQQRVGCPYCVEDAIHVGCKDVLPILFSCVLGQLRRTREGQSGTALGAASKLLPASAAC